MKLRDGYRVLLTRRSKYVAASGTIRLIPDSKEYVLVEWDTGPATRVDINFFTYDWIYVAKDEKEALAIILKLNG